MGGVNALPDGWSIGEVAGDVVIHLRPAGLSSTYVLSRAELLTIMELLADAVGSADERAGRTLVHGLGSLEVGHILEGWAVSVENTNVTLDVDSGNLAGHYVLNVEQASTLWRSLAAAYRLADKQIQEILSQALFGDDGSSGVSL